MSLAQINQNGRPDGQESADLRTIQTKKIIAPRIPALDGIRGVAVIAILVFHLINNSSILNEPGLLQFFQLLTKKLWLGVDLFFVLSGFLIGRTLITTRDRPNYYSSFFIRRASRILPIYYIWVGLFLVLRAFGAEKLGGGFSLLLGGNHIPAWHYLTFTQNFTQAASDWGPYWVGVTWSLAIEMQFYLLAPFIVRAVPPRHLATTCCGIIFAVNLLRVLASGALSNHALIVHSFSRLDSPFFGMLLACVLSRGKPDQIKKWLGAYPKTAASSLVLAYYLGVSFGPQSQGQFLLMMALTPFAFGILILAFATAPVEPACGRPTVFLCWIGVRGYAVYLFHQAIVHMLAHMAYGTPAFFQPGQGSSIIIAAFVLTLVFAGLSWRYLERPMIDAGRRWIAAMSGA